MNFANVKSITIPEGAVKRILRGAEVLWKSGFKNWVIYSTEADGATIYNGGKGYKDGYRIRSGGAEQALDVASISGFIPLKGGDIVRLSGYDVKNANTSNAINVYDAAKTNIGQVVGNYPSGGYGIFQSTYGEYGWSTVTENPTGVFTWVAPPSADIAFMRVTGHTNGDGSTMIVAVNEEITL